MTQSSQPELAKPLAPERPPFAGFMPRLGAFAIDLVLIYFVGYSLELFARNLLLELGAFLPFFSYAGAFAYFWLANGPVGQGTTVGKAILNLHVVKPDGGPLGMRASFRRTVLQFPIVFSAAFVFIDELIGLHDLFAVYLGSFLLTASITLIIAHGYCVFSHPRRRGWHDLWADDYVTYDPTPSEFLQAIEAEIDESMAAKLAAQKRSSLFFVLLVGLLMIGPWFLGVVRRERRENWKLMAEITRTLEVDGYRVRGFEFITFEQLDLVAEELGLNESAPMRMDATETNASLESIEVHNRELAVLLEFERRRGASTFADSEDPERQFQLNEIRLERLEPLIAALNASNPEAPRPRRIIARFGDNFRFVIFSQATGGYKARWIAQGPMDPGEGPLTYERIKTDEERDAAGEGDAAGGS